MSVLSFDRSRSRREIVAALQRLLLQRDSSVESKAFYFDIAAIDSHLPEGGLSLAAVHEILPDAADDRAAAFGFLTALLCRIPRNGPVVIVSAPGGSASGHIHGHGLQTIGLDPARVIQVAAGDDIQVHWVIEEALKSAAPAAVSALLKALPDLKTSRRFQLAADKSGVPLLILRPAFKGKSSAGVTRWRIGAAQARLDPFGLIAAWRWRVALDRCRNGRLGEWLVEFDHDTHRFSLAAEMAGPALSQGAVAQSLTRRAG